MEMVKHLGFPFWRISLFEYMPIIIFTCALCLTEKFHRLEFIISTGLCLEVFNNINRVEKMEMVKLGFQFW